MEKDISSSTTKHSPQQLIEVDRAKRPKQFQQAPPSTIIQLSSQAHTNIFEGDVLTRYGPALNKNPSSPPKVQVLHADLVDKDGHMTITVTMKNNVITLFKDQFSPGNSVHINGFSLVNKGQYDRGDAKLCILLNERSIVQTISQVCLERKLAPDTTIHELVDSSDNYAVGSIAAIVIACQQVDNQFELSLKDRDATNDTSMLLLHDAFKDICIHIQQQLALKLLPIYIFKNVVRNGLKGSQAMRAGPSTFVDALNDDCAKAHLLSFVQSKTQVQGQLRAKNVYAPPFRQCCTVCKKTMSGSPLCRTCKQPTTTEYQHCIECTLETTLGKTDCLLEMPLLEKYCPAIARTSFQAYTSNFSSTVFQLRAVHITGLFTLTLDNTISEIQML